MLATQVFAVARVAIGGDGDLGVVTPFLYQSSFNLFVTCQTVLLRNTFERNMAAITFVVIVEMFMGRRQGRMGLGRYRPKE